MVAPQNPTPIIKITSIALQFPATEQQQWANTMANL